MLLTRTGTTVYYSPLMDYSRIITIEPNKSGGKPCVRGLRITVSEILDYLASGKTEGEILAAFPDLTSEDLRACIAFAADRERGLMTAAGRIPEGAAPDAAAATESFLDTALSMQIEGPPDWSENVDNYLREVMRFPADD